MASVTDQSQPRDATAAAPSSSSSPAQEECRVDLKQLTEFCAKCLVQAGSLQERADIVADVLVTADARGISSHGVNRLELYCHELKRGAVDASASPAVINETPGTALVDGNNAQGGAVGHFCMQLAISKAKANGVGWVVARNSNHYGIAGYWTEMAARAGMVGLSMTNTSPVVVPTRAKKPALGTNPIACSGPTPEGTPVTLDMATSTVPLGRMEVYRRKGLECPTGWGVDGDGKATNDPSKVIFEGGLNPLGGQEETAGYKGYGLAFLVEMMCGVMADADSGPDIGMVLNPKALNRTKPVNLGQCFVAVNPDAFAPGYGERLANLAEAMRKLPAAEASKPVLAPGDPEVASYRDAVENGVRLHVKIASALVQLARDMGVDSSEVPLALRSATTE